MNYKALNPSSFYIVKAELNQTIWRVPLKEIIIAAKLGKSLYIVDIYNHFVSSTYPLFVIENYLELKDIDFVYLQYEQEEVVILPPIICKLLFRFHSGWINLMYEYFTSTNFAELLEEITKVKNSGECFPIGNDIFNCFVVNPNDLKGAIISEFSYRNKWNSGYALATFEKEKPPTLKAIEDTIKINKSFNWYLQNDLLDLVSKGCLLFNYNLINDYSNKQFITEICNVLKNLNTPTLLLGTGIFKLELLLGTSVLKEKHPLEVLIKKEIYTTSIFQEFEEKTKIIF